MNIVPQCSVQDCEGRHEAKGLCQKHYARLRRTGTLEDPFTASCTLEGCSSPHHANGLCSKHYHQPKYEDYKPRAAAYRAKNSEALKAQKAVYRELNREAIRGQGRNYYINNTEVARRSREKRRARLAETTFEDFTESQVLELYGTDCHLCGEAVDLKAPRKPGIPGWETGLHIDHVVSLAKGGEHSLANVRPAHGECNLRKGRG